MNSIPAIIAEIRREGALLWPSTSAKVSLQWAYTGKYIAEKGISLRKQALDPF